MHITIATWNIAGGRPIRSDERFDYDKEDLGYFAEELKKINPDIVALQESHKNDLRSVAADLAKLIGLRVHADDVFSHSHIDPDYQLSLATLSNLEDVWVEEDIFPYPTFPLVLPNGKPAVRHDKGMQMIELEVGNNPLNLINLQMLPLPFLGASYESEDGLAFAKEMEKLISIHTTQPFSVIVGDFNYGKAETLYSTELLVGMKSVLPEGPTRPNGKKTDYIFVPESYKVVESAIVQTRSDHFLCWATLEIA